MLRREKGLLRDKHYNQEWMIDRIDHHDANQLIEKDRQTTSLITFKRGLKVWMMSLIIYFGSRYYLNLIEKIIEDEKL